MGKKRKLIIAILLPVQIILVKILSNYPAVIEQYYSRSLYTYIAKILKTLLGWIPFSFGDIAYMVLFIFMARWCYKNFRNFYRKPKTTFINVAYFLSIVFFTFHFVWGMNYHRLPLHESLHLKKTYTTDELVTVTERLITKANAIHTKITANDSLKVTVPYDRNQIFEKALNGYSNLGNQFQELRLNSVSLKKSIISLPLTYMGFGGYLNPFTLESQVNYLIPKYRYPNVTCHELAHQLGFAAENEANFIGSLASMYNQDIYFNYSGTVFAVRSCLNDLYRRDKTEFERLLNTLNYGIRENFKESRDFWKSYENPIEPLFKNSYDAYLKANNQNKGINSYSYVVALLVNFNGDHGLY